MLKPEQIEKINQVWATAPLCRGAWFSENAARYCPVVALLIAAGVSKNELERETAEAIPRDIWDQYGGRLFDAYGMNFEDMNLVIENVDMLRLNTPENIRDFAATIIEHPERFEFGL